MGCGNNTTEPDKPVVKEKTAVEPVEPKLPVVDPNWDPSKPVEPSTLKIQTMFVVVRQSALCPTREQAQARECGNSIESVDQGTIEEQGSAIPVVGEAPVDGFWKALRYQKAGILPSWIRADDLAKTPKTNFLDEWDKRPDVAKAQDVTKLSAKKLARLKKGKVVKWPRSGAVKYGAFGDRTLVFMDLGKAGTAAIELPPPSSESNNYIEYHRCMIAGDCLALSYICGEDYCDQVSILAVATGTKVPPPDDPEDEWRAGTKPMPLFTVIAIADRFGTFLGSSE
jgi:hypothetical protein